MRNLLKFLSLMCFVMLFSGCTNESIDNDLLIAPMQSELNQPPCVDDDPITRVINNGTIPYDFQVIDSEGVIIVDIPMVPPNTTTSWASFTPGEVLFLIDGDDNIAGDDKVLLQMDTCMAYEIEIDSNNTIVSYTPTTL